MIELTSSTEAKSKAKDKWPFWGDHRKGLLLTGLLRLWVRLLLKPFWPSINLDDLWCELQYLPHLRFKTTRVVL